MPSLESLRKQRKTLRGTVTRLVTSLEGHLTQEELPRDQVTATLNLLESGVEKLAEADEQIRILMCEDEDVTDEALEAEALSAEDYAMKASLIRVKVDEALHPRASSSGRTSPAGSASASVTSQKRNFKLPKIELKKFSGELTEWLGWWAQFSKIDEDEELHSSDKFSYLIQSMVEGSKALDLVKRFPQSSENYPKAVEALKERFGKPKLLRQVYIRELIRMILNTRNKEKTSLSSLVDKLESSLRSLESLQVSTEHMVEFLFPMVESSLPEETLVAWQRSPNFGVDGSQLVPPKSELTFLMEFLKLEVNNEEQRKLAKSGFGLVSWEKKTRQKDHQEEDQHTAAGLHSASSSGQKSCIFCGKGHESRDCFKAQRMTMEERKKLIQEKRACFTCLKIGHISKRCNAKVQCQVCGKKHPVLLCPGVISKKGTDDTSTPETTISSNLNCTSEVLLRTLMVDIVNPISKKKKRVRVLLDCGSQRSYLLRKTVKDLELEASESLKINHVLFGGNEVLGQTHGLFDVNIQSIHGNFSFPVTLMDQAQICGRVPRVNNGHWIKQLRRQGILVNDGNPKDPSEVEVLIGADYLGYILTGKIAHLDNGLFATETKLGWALMGRRKEESIAMSAITMTITSSSVRDLWRLETIGINDPVETKSKEERERETEEHFAKTVKRKPDGRYSVCLPWIGGSTILPSNRAVAEQRLQSTTRKLNSLQKFEAYNKVFQDWEKEGIISIVKEEDAGRLDKCHYLPHRPVFKESKTTPVRPVFDASCKIGRHPSLNQCLEKGPNLLDVIPSILLRFRMGRIGVLADIRKAFLMVDVSEEDRDYLRFLWWEDSSQKTMRTYQHNRVVFGMNCSPFLLGAVITHHLNQQSSSHPEIAKQMKESLYVDNLVTSVNTQEEYDRLKDVATTVMSTAKMELRQWEKTGCVEAGEETNVLGLKWDKLDDTLLIAPIQPEMDPVITKRVILSQLQRIYDPLGFLAPVLVTPKVFLQKAWVANKSWDEVVTDDIRAEFEQWWNEMTSVLEKIRIPRNCDGGRKKEDNKFQLHAFSDASKKAYAAVVFLRVESEEGVQIQLLQAKTRVAPIEKASIPRLELLSCTISARLAASVKKALELEEIPTFFWTDSTTALSWIKRNDEWGTFVGNRVKEITHLTKVDQWRHVPGTLNPADLPSRGISPLKFVELRWWEGPSWLKLDPKEWPQQELKVDEAAVNQERKRISTLTNQTTAAPWYVRSNSYSSNLRIMARVFRFVDLLRKRTTEKSDSPTPEEINSTELRLFKLVQEEEFNGTGRVISGVKVVRDKEGFIRVKTKLLHREDNEFFKWPILLPNSHPLVDLKILDEHRANSHGGVQFLMSKIREKAWIIYGKKAIKRVIRGCVRCQRFQSRKSEVPTSALPGDRVKDASAFQVTGIDLAGPLTLKDSSKVYIVLFTCAVYRAVHLELVESLSAEDFLLAFARFCRRKRRPETIYTDNGGNFTKANSLCSQLDWANIEKRTQTKRIKWIFNPPSAPWWGGWWERLVRSVKDLLRKQLGFQKLNYVELETCLVEAEWVVNHRPLSFVSEDSDDLVPLTPAMFLYDLPSEDVPEAKLLTVAHFGRTRKNLKTLLDGLRERFRAEYLGQLVQRGKERKIREFQVGEVVLVEMDNKKRIFWPMARITELFPGKDGHVRVAKLRTKHGSIIRPIQRLFPLEVKLDELNADTNVQKAVTIEKMKATEEGINQQQSDVKPEGEAIVTTRSGRVVHKPVKFCDY